MKRVVALAAAALTLAACGSAPEATTSSTTRSSTTSHDQTATSSSATSKTPGPSPSSTSSTQAPETPADDPAAEDFDTTTYMSDMWSSGTREETGWMCIMFRAEPDEQMGEDAVVDAITSSVEGLDREEVRDFLDEKCPTAAEMEANADN